MALNSVPDAARSLAQHLKSLRALGVTMLPSSALQASERPLRSLGEAGSSTPRSAGGSKASALRVLEQQVITCTRCTLYRTRTRHVFGEGAFDAKLVFVGEAPGRDEDLQGRPFVGAAGQLLTKMIEAIGLKREEVYICNVLKDRPPNNRLPEPDEMEACTPYLISQLTTIQPRVICTLGAIATKALLGPHVAITQIRGSRREFHGIPLIPTFHPAYLLRNPPAKKFVWQDLKRVKQLLTSD